MRSLLICVALFLIGGLSASPAAAALVTEYFNGYGGAQGDILGKGTASGGWAGAWQGNANPNFIPNTHLTYGAAGYDNSGNNTGATDGALISNSGATNNISFRLFAPGTVQTGTIWLSVLTRFDGNTDDILFWLDKTNENTTGADRTFLALRGSTGNSGSGTPPEALIAYNGADDSASNIDFGINTTHLFLAKIQMNASGANDSITWWVNPDLTGGEAGLGATVGSMNGPVYVKSGADAFGSTFDGIGFSANGSNSLIDAIRVSNDADGFAQVTAVAVPEPSSFVLAAIALLSGLGLVRRR